jgi:hypothetical protein
MRTPKTIVALGAMTALGGSTAAVALAADTPVAASPDPTVATAPAPDPVAEAAAAKRQQRHRRLVLGYRKAAHRVHHQSKRGHTRWTDAQLRRKTKALHKQARIANRRPTGVLAAIAECESHSNPRAVSASGTFRGMYQFSISTWRAVGGKGDPIHATVGEQTKRAKILYARQGSSPWPVCGR